MKAALEVAVAGQESHSHPIEEHAVIGAGPGADIVVDAPGVAPQHFRLTLGARYVVIRLAPGASPLRYRGKAFSGGRLAYGRDFYLEHVRFHCAVPLGSAGRARWLLAMVLLVAGASASAALALGRERRAAERPASDAIELFTPSASCPELAPAAARRRAERSERAAEAKLERRRYDPHDGVAAGRLYAEASACFATAGDEAARSRSERVGVEVRSRVTEELRAAQLRLRAALADEQTPRALEELAGLRRLLRDETHPYARWLEREERELRARASER